MGLFEQNNAAQVVWYGAVYDYRANKTRAFTIFNIPNYFNRNSTFILRNIVCICGGVGRTPDGLLVGTSSEYLELV